MADEKSTVQELKNLVAAFVNERDWNQFHTPKNLAMSIAIEAAELMEIFQWCDKEKLDEEERARVEEELADVVIYCLSMANATGLDLAGAVKKKLAVNAVKYPVERFRGRYR